MTIVSNKFVDRKSAKIFAERYGAKVERYIDPTGYFKFIVRLNNTNNDTKKKDN